MNTRAGLLVAGALLAAAGCGGGSSDGTNQGDVTPVTTPTHTHHPKATPTPTPTPTVTQTATAAPVTESPTATAPVALARCLSSHLSLALGEGQGAAGTTYAPVVFTNTGSTACELHGYPGVSFVDSSGHQIGKPATEDSGAVKTIKLGSGKSAFALLRQPNPGNFDPGTCQQTTADRLKVYPPGETVPLYVSDPAPVCSTSAGRTGVAALAAGNGS